jgi:hypothetical protein
MKRYATLDLKHAKEDFKIKKDFPWEVFLDLVLALILLHGHLLTK